jgi:general L-amino acid transport system substrate-binding protein
MTRHWRRAIPMAIALGFVSVLGAPAMASGSAVLKAMRARGHLICGLTDGPRGYSAISPQGEWSGIGPDFCRALAVAALGSKEAVRFRVLNADDRFAALQAREIDVLAGNLAMTASRDTSLGLRFPGILVYDGQGFLVRKSQGIQSALELSGARICVTSATTDELGVTEFLATLKIPFELLRFETWQEVAMAYANKSCQAISADLAILAQTRQQLADPAEHIILPELASKQPVGPAVLQGDEDWFSVVRWTLYALVAAEEFGITSANADSLKSSAAGDMRRFLVADSDFAKRLALGADWTQRVIKQVGNYGEIYDRTLGLKSPLRLERRLNNLASNGGLHYAPPFR